MPKKRSAPGKRLEAVKAQILSPSDLAKRLKKRRDR